MYENLPIGGFVHFFSQEMGEAARKSRKNSEINSPDQQQQVLKKKDYVGPFWEWVLKHT